MLPAGFAVGLASAIAGDAVTGLHDPAKFLDVDVHKLSGARALVPDDILSRRFRPKPGDTVPAQDCVHGRCSDTNRPADHVRSFAQILTRAQDCPLDGFGCPPG
jgi:hypothetical protein